VILWELITRQVPYQGMKSREVAEFVTRGHRLDIPADCPSEYHNLIRSCWQHNPDDRPAFPEIVRRLEAIEKSWFPPEKTKGFPN